MGGATTSTGWTGPDDLLAGKRVALADFSAWGITTVHGMSSGPLEVGAYQRLPTAEELTTRFRPWPPWLGVP